MGLNHEQSTILNIVKGLLSLAHSSAFLSATSEDWSSIFNVFFELAELNSVSLIKVFFSPSVMFLIFYKETAKGIMRVMITIPSPTTIPTGNSEQVPDLTSVVSLVS